MLNDLPSVLSPFREKILATATDFIELIPCQNAPEYLWESKLSGAAYLPPGAELPLNNEGKTLALLAQINCAELPPLPLFPQQGILQFFINDDSLFGYKQPDNYAVRYYPEVIKTGLPEAAPLRNFSPDLPMDPHRSYSLKFKPQQELLGPVDYQFDQVYGADFFAQFEDADEIWDYFFELNQSGGHKMGGYAHFTQEDPRQAEDPMLLLLQIDSDAAIQFMWGDMGIANFFIRPADLEKRDFSKVIFHWDCA